MRKPVLGALVAAALTSVLSSTTPAAANGRFPASNQIVFSPTDPKVIFGRTTFALIPSSDDGATWSYLCEGLLALPTVTNYQDPELAFTSNGTLVAGLFAPTKGVSVSKDLGCSWSCNATLDATQQVVDTVVRPDMQSHVLALVSNQGALDGGNLTQVYESTDDGATWSVVGKPIDPAVIVQTIDVATTDPARIYVSGTRGFGATRTASLFVSTDTGQTWNEYPVGGFKVTPGGGGEDSVYIAGVDPTNADQVYVRSSGSSLGGLSCLYASSDGGKTITKVNTFYVEAAGSALVGELLGFALSPDGSTVYIGTKESGLWSASRSDLVFSNINPNVAVQCLATRTAGSSYELWACGNEFKGAAGSAGNFIFGKSTDRGKTFQGMLPTLTSLKGIAQCTPRTDSTPLACGATPEASTCGCDEYTAFCSNIESPNACLGCGQTGVSDDGGADDAGAGDASLDATVDGGHQTVKTSSSSCGCSLVGLARGGPAGGIGPGAIAGLALLTRRRKKS